jgi:hypothetical protein
MFLKSDRLRGSSACSGDFSISIGFSPTNFGFTGGIGRAVQHTLRAAPQRT